MAVNLYYILLTVYEILILSNHALSHYFRATLQLHNLLVNCAKELFKPLKDLVSLLACNEKYVFNTLRAGV